MKHLWDEIAWYKYGDDRHGIVEHFGKEPSAADLAEWFEGTHAGAWGNILRGQAAGGTYGEIIMGIKKYGISAFLDDGHWRNGAKNKSERFKKGRAKREQDMYKRLQIEPCF